MDVSSPLYLPTTAKVGQSGALNGGTAYADQTKTTVLGYEVNSRELDADTASTALLCIKSIDTDGRFDNPVQHPDQVLSNRQHG